MLYKYNDDFNNMPDSPKKKNVNHCCKYSEDERESVSVLTCIIGMFFAMTAHLTSFREMVVAMDKDGGAFNSTPTIIASKNDHNNKDIREVKYL